MNRPTPTYHPFHTIILLIFQAKPTGFNMRRDTSSVNIIIHLNSKKIKPERSSDIFLYYLFSVVFLSVRPSVNFPHFHLLL